MSEEVAATVDAALAQLDRAAAEASVHDDPCNCRSPRWPRSCARSVSFMPMPTSPWPATSRRPGSRCVTTNYAAR